MPALDRLQIRGFKSIREADLELRSLNVLIGANGAGKSNLVGVFELLHALVQERLQLHVAKAGGADSLLYFGRRVTDEIELRFRFGNNAYECELVPTSKDSLAFKSETLYYKGPAYSWDNPYSYQLGQGHSESRVRETSRDDQGRFARPVRRRPWRSSTSAFPTSSSASSRRPSPTRTRAPSWPG